MKIVIDPAVMLRLMTISTLYHKEFSGFGFCDLEKDVIRIYDFVLLDVGSEVFTEIPTEKIIALMDREDAPKMKVWLHRHPMGSGKPGPENWSGMDENTIKTAPLGGLPELVKWSVSVVLTPRGWVGRIDNYISHKTMHLEVEPQAPEAYEMLGQVLSIKKVERPAPFFMPKRPDFIEAWNLYRQPDLLGDDEEEIEGNDDFAFEDDRVEALDALEECGLTLEDLTKLGTNLYDFFETYNNNGCDPEGTLNDLVTAARHLNQIKTFSMKVMDNSGSHAAQRNF